MRFLFILFIFLSFQAEARVFQFKSEGVAAYFAGGAGDATTVGTTPFSKISGSDTKYNSDAKPSYTQSFEFGFLMTVKESLTFKFGAELFKVPTNSKVIGYRADGVTKRFDLVSEVSVFNPHLTIEYNFSPAPQNRLFGFAGVGYGQLTSKHTYTFAPEGLTDFTNVTSDYASIIKANFINYQLGMGYETLFTDNVTFYSLFSYRFMDVLSASYSYDGESINGAAVSGASAIDNDSQALRLSMGGLYIGLGFRFYIETR